MFDSTQLIYRKWCENQSDVDIIRHIDSVLISFAHEAVDSYALDGYFTEQDILQNEHALLLLDAGLLEEYRFGENGFESCFYKFFDPLIHEYTCALLYSKLIIDRPEELVSISNILFSYKWRNVTVLVAGLLGRKLTLLLKGLNFDSIISEETLIILADCLHQCQCSSIVLKHVPKFDLSSVLDFSSLHVTETTFKGKVNNVL